MLPSSTKSATLSPLPRLPWVILFRDKFKYHCELQNRVREEIFEQLITMIAEINEDNKAEFLIYPYQLSKILSVI